MIELIIKDYSKSNLFTEQNESLRYKENKA